MNKEIIKLLAKFVDAKNISQNFKYALLDGNRLISTNGYCILTIYLKNDTNQRLLLDVTNKAGGCNTIFENIPANSNENELKFYPSKASIDNILNKEKPNKKTMNYEDTNIFICELAQILPFAFNIEYLLNLFSIKQIKFNTNILLQYNDISYHLTGKINSENINYDFVFFINENKRNGWIKWEKN